MFDFIEQMERRFAEEMESAKRMERPYYRVSGARDAVVALYNAGALTEEAAGYVAEWMESGALALTINNKNIVPRPEALHD